MSAESEADQEPVNLLDVPFARACERFHKLGPRALAELLAEVGAQFLIRQPIEAALQRYIDRLDRDLLLSLGIDRFPPSPLWIIPGDLE